MKRKSFLLVLCLFLVTGCSDSIEYKIDMGSEKNSIQELIQLEIDSEDKDDNHDETDNPSGEPLVVNCWKNALIDGGYSQVQYEIHSLNDQVEKIVIAEKKAFQDATIMNSVLSELSKKEALYQNLEYYSYYVAGSDNVIYEVTEFDYTNIDVNKINELHPEIAQFINNGKLKLSDAKTVYQQLGAVCE